MRVVERASASASSTSRDAPSSSFVAPDEYASEAATRALRNAWRLETRRAMHAQARTRARDVASARETAVMEARRELESALRRRRDRTRTMTEGTDVGGAATRASDGRTPNAPSAPTTPTRARRTTRATTVTSDVIRSIGSRDRARVESDAFEASVLAMTEAAERLRASLAGRAPAPAPAPASQRLGS